MRMPQGRKTGAWAVRVALLFCFGYALGRIVSFGPLMPKEAVYLTLHGEDPRRSLLQALASARQAIDVAVYALDDAALVQALERAKQRGVRVRLITDRREVERPEAASGLARLRAAGVPVKVNDGAGLMHLKLVLIDGRLAAAGSYNWTAAAAALNEELLVWIGDPDAVQALTALFDRLWADEVYYRRVGSGS
ncbi:phospholipase D-like domain-containing protein [Hydrogenibacillus schlegelii]|nr:phospholipase D-like domain-containing protein [Hydrogenibacillus schlegelii]